MWKIEWFDGTNWVEKTDAVLKQIVQELNGHEEAVFTIPNTSDNRTFVNTDKRVRILWSTTEVYQGLMQAARLKQTEIECTVYNECYEKMKSKIHSDEYRNTAADIILGNICSDAGVVAGQCPTTPIDYVRFEKAVCFDAATFLAECLGKDYWSDYNENGNPRFHIGDRVNSEPYPSLTPLEIPSRGIDRAKKRDRVIIRGIGADGNRIYGEAGTGTNVAVFTEDTPSDQETLNNLAAAKLAELNKESSGVQLTVVITEAYNLFPGDYVTLNIPEIGLVGNFRIWKITKKVDSAVVEVESPESSLDRTLEDFSRFEQLGIITKIPDRLTVEKITYKNPAEPTWLVSQRNITMQDMADPSQRIPTIHIDQTLWTRKDFFCQGFVGADSLFGYVMSETGYVPPDENSLGKMVYRVADNMFVGFLGWYDNVNRYWFIIPSGVPINIGDTLKVNVTGAQGTVTQMFHHTGGGALQLGDGFTAPFDNPWIVLTKSWANRDVLDVMTLDKEPAKVRLKEVWFGGRYILRFSETGYVGCVDSDRTKDVVYEARGWNNELKKYKIGTLVDFDNTSRVWIVSGNGQNVPAGTYVYVDGGTGKGYLSETSTCDVKMYRNENAIRVETPADGGLAVEQNLYARQLVVDENVYLTNLPTI